MHVSTICIFGFVGAGSTRPPNVCLFIDVCGRLIIAATTCSTKLFKTLTRVLSRSQAVAKCEQAPTWLVASTKKSGSRGCHWLFTDDSANLTLLLPHIQHPQHHHRPEQQLLALQVFVLQLLLHTFSALMGRKLHSTLQLLW